MTSPKPWELVPGTEHHGPYITSAFGTTLCDFYCMSEPDMLSTASGGPSKPILFADAEENAAYVVKAVNLHEELCEAVYAALGMVEREEGPPNWDWFRSILKRAEWKEPQP